MNAEEDNDFPCRDRGQVWTPQRAAGRIVGAIDATGRDGIVPDGRVVAINEHTQLAT